MTEKMSGSVIEPPKLVYLDAQASTPLCEEAAVSMRRYVESDGGGLNGG